MSKTIHNPSRTSPSAGFTLLELMVAMSLSLILFGLAFNVAQQLNNIADTVGSMSDVNENLRAAVNMVSRDLQQSGQNIPVGGIPIPSGGSATALNRPGPGGLTFPATGSMSVITTGYALGPTQGSGANAINTDIVTLITVNQTSPFNQTAVTANPTVAAAQATITVSTAAAANVTPGQLIMLINANGSCLLAASSVNTATGVITCTHGDTTNDPLGVNQFYGSPTTGTINQLQTSGSGTWPKILAYPVTMTTYYLDTSTPRRLMKQITMATAQPVALGINVMTITYYCSSGTSPTRNPGSPGSIQKVALTMIGETDHQNHASSTWYSKSVTNAVAIQNLDFHNKYSLHASMTQN
jgi:prepilin-type N-terminal cleavage/methylation domain-containing protein